LGKLETTLNLNFKYPEFRIGFRWVHRDICGSKFNARIVKTVNRIEDHCPERCPYCYRKNNNPQLEYWFHLFHEFRMKYFKDILYKNFNYYTTV
jgi:hypothetical protein